MFYDFIPALPRLHLGVSVFRFDLLISPLFAAIFLKILSQLSLYLSTANALLKLFIRSGRFTRKFVYFSRDKLEID